MNIITGGYSSVCLRIGPAYSNMKKKIDTNWLSIKNNMSTACDVCERIVFFDMRNK